MKLTSILFVAAPFVFAGCTVTGPDYTTPPNNLEVTWEQQDPSLRADSRAKVNIAWWQQFNDPQLSMLVGKAYSQNLGLRIAALRILESRALLGVAYGNQFPQSQALSGNLLQNRVGPPSSDRHFSSASIGFDAAWEIDFWGKFRRSIQSAAANVSADMADYDDILVSLTAEVATTYVNIRTLEERIRFAKQNAKLQEDSRKLVELQLDAGTVNELDVYQAKTLLSTTKAQIPNLRTLLIRLHNALATLLGQQPGTTEELLKGGKGIPDAPANLAVGLPAELLRRRPDIRRSEMTALAQCQQIGIAKTDLYPSFTLLGSLETASSSSGTMDISDIFNDDNIGYTFGPSFRWNILNYGRIKNNVRVQDARFEQTITAYQDNVLRAAREVEDGMAGFIQAKQEAGFLKEGVDASEKAAKLSTIQYEEGLTDYQRLLDSIRSLTTRQDQYTATRGVIATDLIAVYKALGGGWELRKREDALPAGIKEKMKQRTDWGELLDPPPAPAPVAVNEGNQSK